MSVCSLVAGGQAFLNSYSLLLVMNLLKTWKGTLSLIVIVVVVGAAFMLSQDFLTGRVISVDEYITLSINPVPNSALIFIAEEKGYFEEQGIVVDYRGFPTGKLALDALIGGGSDIATTADVPIALAGLAQQDISVIATIEYSTDNIQVVARKDAGIYGSKDLVGKTIATTRGNGPMFFTYKFLERHDIDISDVNILFLNPSDMVTTLVRGDIDAFIVFEPFPFLAREELGLDSLIIFSPSDLYGETWNIVVMKDYENESPGVIKKFIRSLLKAETFLQNNPEESLLIVSEYSETEPDILSEIMKKQNYEIVLNELLTDSLDEEAVWAMEQEFTTTTTAPDYSLIINTLFLQELKPSSVGI